MNTEFEDRLRAEMGRVEVLPRPGLVREAYEHERQRQRTRRRAALAATSGVAAAAAATTAVVLPPHTGPHRLAERSAKPVVRAKSDPSPALPASVPTSAPPVTYSIKAAAADVTVVDVLTKAAAAVGSQTNPGPGWPAGAYWHTEQEVISGGQLVSTDNIWMDASDNGVGEGTDAPPYPISNPAGQLPAAIGEKSYTWAQLDALPTDPAKLWAIVKADEQLPFSSDPALPKSGQSDLFESIWNLVTSEPVPAPLRKALYEVAEKIPGVTVEGQYADSLGRTGTALHIGMWTMVVDPGTGQILAMMQAAGPPVTVCGSTGCTEQQTAGASTSVYITAGWASAASLPKLPRGSGRAPGSDTAYGTSSPTPSTNTGKP